MHVGATPSSPAKISVPFPVLAGLKEVVRHPAWLQAFAAVRAGLQAGTPVVLFGDPGLGKSLLLKALEHALRQEGQTVVLLPGSDGAGGRPDVVLLDEADRVPPELLMHLVGSAPHCVLAGPPTLPGTLAVLAATPILVEMRPLRDDEVGPYLSEQIERAGLPDALLGPGAFDAIARHGGGNPRRLQKLASRALFRAWIDNADQVSVAHVAEAVAQDDPAASFAADEPVAEAPPPPVQAGAEPVAAEREPVLPGLSPVPAPHSVPAPRSMASKQATWPSPLRTRPWVAALGAAVLCSAVVAVFAVRQNEPRTAAPLPPQTMVTADANRAAHPPVAEPGPVPAPLPAVPPEAGSVPAPPAVSPAAEPEPVIAMPPAVAEALPPPAPDVAPPPPVAPQVATLEPAIPRPGAPELPAQQPPAQQPPAPQAAAPEPAAPEPAAPEAAAPEVAPPVPQATATALPEPPFPSLPRPSAIPVHVIVASAPSDAAAGTQGVALVGALKEAGMDAVLAVGPVNEQNRAVRYFYPADQSAAAQVARRMGEAGRERLVAIRGIPPRPGTIQVVIPSRQPSGGRASNPTRLTEEKKVP